VGILRGRAFALSLLAVLAYLAIQQFIEDVDARNLRLDTGRTGLVARSVVTEVVRPIIRDLHVRFIHESGVCRCRSWYLQGLAFSLGDGGTSLSIFYSVTSTVRTRLDQCRNDSECRSLGLEARGLINGICAHSGCTRTGYGNSGIRMRDDGSLTRRDTPLKGCRGQDQGGFR
jgi:hypothetical protein